MAKLPGAIQGARIVGERFVRSQRRVNPEGRMPVMDHLRELRHTFVSLLSSDGMPLEDIADLVGHKGTLTTETVYRKVIVPELRRGAEVMDRLFS